MHWAVVVLPPALALAACAGLALYQQIQMMQQREREQQYWEPFRHAVPASLPAQPRCCPLQSETAAELLVQSKSVRTGVVRQHLTYSTCSHRQETMRVHAPIAWHRQLERQCALGLQADRAAAGFSRGQAASPARPAARPRPQVSAAQLRPTLLCPWLDACVAWHPTQLALTHVHVGSTPAACPGSVLLCASSFVAARDPDPDSIHS